jgi:hypothetical protein
MKLTTPINISTFNLKMILRMFIFSILSITILSCETVIDLPLETAPPRLVIDASIDWEQGTDGSYQNIRLSTTTGFYDMNIPTVSGATVLVRKGNQTFTFIENPENLGLYECFDFDAEIGATYELQVLLNGQEYKAVEQMIDVPEILFIEQGTFSGFGAESFEFRFFFQDNPNEANSYMSKLKIPARVIPEYAVFDDRFTNGNLMFDLVIEDEIEVGEELNFTLFGISSNYFEYMRKILSIANQGGGSPFQTPPATVRGNIINQTEFNNFAFGYFRLSKTFSVSYVVQEPSN